MFLNEHSRLEEPLSHFYVFQLQLPTVNQFSHSHICIEKGIDIVDVLYSVYDLLTMYT